MSKTISFVASDELAEYLEAEAERRMTTISSTAQMLLAEKYRQDRRRAKAGSRQEGGEARETAASGDESERPEGGEEWVKAAMRDIAEHEREHGEVPRAGDLDGGQDEPAKHEDVLDEYPDAWYQPDSDKHDYAVEVPEGADVYDHGKTRYYKTRTGAAEALRRWYANAGANEE